MIALLQSILVLGLSAQTSEGPLKTNAEGAPLFPSDIKLLSNNTFKQKAVLKGKLYVVTVSRRGMVRWLPVGHKFDDAEILSIGESGVEVKFINPKPGQPETQVLLYAVNQPTHKASK